MDIEKLAAEMVRMAERRFGDQERALRLTLSDRDMEIEKLYGDIKAMRVVLHGLIKNDQKRAYFASREAI